MGRSPLARGQDRDGVRQEVLQKPHASPGSSISSTPEGEQKAPSEMQYREKLLEGGDGRSKLPVPRLDTFSSLVSW
jgi:hypothetical protein